MTAGPLTLVFWDAERGREDRYDFASLGLPAKVARCFATAFKTITGAHRAITRQHAWVCLRDFARYLTQPPSNPIRRLSDPNVLLLYKENLLREHGPLKPGTFRYYNLGRQLLRWLVANEKDGPWGSAILFRGAPTFVREGRKARRNEVSPQLLRRIASVCKREIDQTIERFGVRERVLQGKEVSSAEIGGVPLDVFRKILAFEAQLIYTQRDLRRIPPCDVPKTGLRGSEPYRCLTKRTVIPYYMLLIIGTCGNPQGIMNLEVDCIQPHPTDPLKSRIYWDKHRSHREQAYDVLAEGRYSAARCVTDLLRLTEPIRALAAPADARKLMLTRTGTRAVRLETGTLHLHLKAFRAEHSLPHFSFADLRKATAAAVDEYAKSARTVKKVLQPRRGRTSWVYLQTRRSVDRRYEGVLQFQGQMLALASRTGDDNGKRSETPASDTLTGMRCRDPVAGIAPGSTKNQPCLQWLECCRCPNAIIVRDDPVVVARIIRAAQSLREMRLQAACSAEATQHYESAFRPTLHVIESQILPRITKRVRMEAEALAARLPAIPLLE